MPPPEEQIRPIPRRVPGYTLVVCQSAIYSLISACLILNLADMLIYAEAVTQISGCGRCLILQYQLILMVVVVLVVFLLCVTAVMVLKRSARGLRFVVMSLFLATWMQMMMIIVLTHEYPIIHDIERAWKSHRSLEFYEDKYECCGMTGPKDYINNEDSLPKSCFKQGSMKSQDLFKDGCSTRSSATSELAAGELVTIFCQYVLIVILILHKRYLERKLVPVRSLRTLKTENIHLPP